MKERNETTEVLSYKKMVQSTPNAAMIFVCNEKIEIIHSNEAMWNLFECKTEEEFMTFCDGSYQNLVAPADRKGMVTVIDEAKRLQHTSVHRDVYRIITKTGKEIEVEDAGGVLQVFEGGAAVFDMLTVRENKERIEVYDQLTGVLKKEQFFVNAERILQQAKAAGKARQYTFVYNNIRNFKFYNMKYGHDVGNLLLQHIARRIQHRGTELMVARYGGDHFISLSNDPNVFQSISEGNALFEEEFEGTGLKIKTGLYRVPDEGVDINVACDLAKIACDTISDSPESVMLYDEELEQRIKLDNYIEENFERAMKNHEIKVFYQPVVRTISGEICGAEALSRWIDPEIGFLSPGRFIPVMERKQLITKLDLYILEQVCKDLRSFIKKGTKLLPISLNLSKLDFMEDNIFVEIDYIVSTYEVPRDLINIEITESIVMSNPERLRQAITTFQKAGYQIWMDDFGSELSSLNVLDEYQFDEIKLDMLFLHSFSERSKELIRSVIQMAKRLGIQTLAEGVETKEQYEYLKEIGCEKVQGYYFSKPVPLEELLQYQKDTKTPVELRAMNDYYDKIGEIDHMTDRSLAIVESDKKDFYFLYMNQEFDRISRDIGDGKNFFTEYMVKMPASALSRKFRLLQKETADGEGFKEMDFFLNGKYFRVRSKLISEHENHMANQVEIENLTWDEAEKKKQKIEHIFRIMYSLYDAIFLMQKDGSFKRIMKRDSKIDDKLDELLEEESIMSREAIQMQYIQDEDRDAFMEFTNPATLIKRLENKEGFYEIRHFHTKMKGNQYCWKVHTMQYIPDSDMLVYSIK